MAEVAKEFKDIKFAIADDQEYATTTMKDFGLDDSGEEFNFGCFKNGKKYGMEPMEEYDEDDIKDFLKKLQKGRTVRDTMRNVFFWAYMNKKAKTVGQNDQGNYCVPG